MIMEKIKDIQQSEEHIVQNLKDAGCDDATIDCFIQEWKAGKQMSGTKLLEKHRRELLNDLHKEQKRIDCLDYLLYMLRKQCAGDEA